MRKTLISTLLRPWAVVLIASMMNICSANASDDCSLRVPLSKIVPELSRGCPKVKEMEKKTEDCIQFGNPEHTNSEAKYDIDRPGHYCLTEDMHARVEFGDHPAERRIIAIWSDNVVLDLQGHTLGRGRLLKNPGGVGINIIDGHTNIRIMNGTLQDFDTAIYRASSRPSMKDVEEVPIHDAQTHTYRFPQTNIVVENVTFKNNGKNIVIEVKKDRAP